MPAFVVEHGFVDHLVRLAIDRGVPPVDAYRMVTLNPATYFGRDAELGGIAPGRYADVCVLADLAEPRPELVIARGRLAAERGRLLARIAEPSWARAFASPRARLAARWRSRREDFALPSRERYPVLRLVSAVISRREDRALAPGDLHAALVDREGRWVAPGVVTGFADGVDGLASTLSTDFNILALGRSPDAMARAVNRLLDRRGGLVLVEGGEIAFELALPIGGIMSRGSFAEAAEAERAFTAALVARGYRHHDPLFTLLFLSADFLPQIRLTPRGVWDVRSNEILLPSRRRAG
jgi:adenine deaminase